MLQFNRDKVANIHSFTTLKLTKIVRHLKLSLSTEQWEIPQLFPEREGNCSGSSKRLKVVVHFEHSLVHYPGDGNFTSVVLTIWHYTE